MNAKTWRSAKYGRGLERAVTEGPGIYAIASVIRIQGLPVHFEVLYVGQSMNLRRRWIEHLRRTEPNPHLHGVANEECLEFWWKTMAAGSLDQAERELIHRLKPSANRNLVSTKDVTEGSDILFDQQ